MPQILTKSLSLILEPFLRTRRGNKIDIALNVTPVSLVNKHSFLFLHSDQGGGKQARRRVTRARLSENFSRESKSLCKLSQPRVFSYLNDSLAQASEMDEFFLAFPRSFPMSECFFVSVFLFHSSSFGNMISEFPIQTEDPCPTPPLPPSLTSPGRRGCRTKASLCWYS